MHFLRLSLVGLALAVCAACGDGSAVDAGDTGAADSTIVDSRVMTDAPPQDTASDAPPLGSTYWISSTGDDTAEGTESAPWRSFSFSIASLTPGDTLIVTTGSTFSAFRYDCQNNTCEGAPCPSGEPGAPITVRAETPRSVRFRNGLDSAFTLRGCSHVVVEGFELTQEEGMTTDTFDQVASISNCDHVVVRDMVIHSINRWINGHMVMLTSSRNVLFEDSELYDFHRGAVMIIGSEHVMARRIYINSRDRANLADPMAYQCCCDPGGDYGFWVDASFDTTIENSIVERTCQSFNVLADDDLLEEPRAGTGNRILGSVALDSRTEGFAVRSVCDDMDPCPEFRRVRDVELVNDASIGARNDGFRFSAVSNAVVRNVTSIDAATDFDFEVSGSNASVDDASFLIVNALDDGVGDIGYQITDQAEGAVLSSNSFGNASVFDPMFDSPEHRMTDPALGGCLVYVPEASPMRGAGGGGEDIGARIVNRYIDGRLTDIPLWEPGTGAFPCGAIIADGINDETIFPGGTCSTVHDRLHVGASGCALP